jgi:hypothetical protein
MHRTGPTSSSVILAVSAVLLVGCTPFHVLDAHTTFMPGPRSFDVTALAPERVAVLGVVTPAGMQGFSPALSHALTTALAEAFPSITTIPSLETVNALNEQGLAAGYADLVSGFARSGILDGKGLLGIGVALQVRYVFLPGLAEFREVLTDRLDVSGLKLVQNRISTLRLWLQLWDTQTGRILWESTGEGSVASEILLPGKTVPFDEIARKLWLRMIREGTVESRPP